MLFLPIILLLFAAIIGGCTNKKVSKEDPDFEIPKSTFKAPKIRKIIYPKGWSKKISINLGPTMSVKEVIKEIADKTNVSINLAELDDIIGISYSGTNISFLRAIKSICRLCGWRIKINQSGDISILKDTSYFHIHEVAFLSNLRKMKSSTNITSISKIMRDDVGTQLYSENDLNLWNEIEQNLKFLLKDEKLRYSLNKQGGLIVINATQSEHEQIATFLKNLHTRIASQVLIEARIVSVELDEKYQNGIEWNLLELSENMIDFGTPATNTAAGKNIIRNMLSGITLLKKFGRTETLSNPRTSVLNNHHAMFKVVTNQVYFKLKSSYVPFTMGGSGKNQPNVINNTQYTVTSDIQMVPVGIIFMVQPSIDFNNNSITLYVKPTISSTSGSVSDPAVSIMQGSGAKTSSEVPIVEEKSIDTVISVGDGEIAVIGGLIEKEGIPGEFGLRNGQFRLKANSRYAKEIVMLVKAQILRPRNTRSLSLQDCEIFDLEESLE